MPCLSRFLGFRFQVSGRSSSADSVGLKSGLQALWKPVSAGGLWGGALFRRREQLPTICSRQKSSGMGIPFIRAIRISLVIFLLFLPGKAMGSSDRVMEDENAVILFPPNLEGMAEEVAEIVPVVKAELQRILGWELHGKPVIVLVQESRRFRQMVENPLTVAFAQPERSLLVVDCSRTNNHPLSLRNVIKHELCHLYIHQYVDNRQVPRWFDEGIAQWASDGISDIVQDRKRSFLNRAAFTGNFLPLTSLSRDFPARDSDFILAYEESKDFIVYMIHLYGKKKVLGILGHLKEGEDTGSAVSSSLGVPLEVLEKDWQGSLESKTNWIAHLSSYLYEFLFAFGAMITVCAFIRIIIKKRRYLREIEEDDMQ